MASSRPAGTIATLVDGAKGMLLDKALKAIAGIARDTFVWVAGEKDDVRAIRILLKSRGHDRTNMHVAWYRERR